MKCKYCKTELGRALVCPNCGAPAPMDKDYKEDWNEMMGYTKDEEEDDSIDVYYQKSSNDQINHQDTRTEVEKSKNMSKLSIIAFVFCVVGFLAIPGIIIAIIDLTKKDGKSKLMSIIAIGVGIFETLYLGFFVYMFQWFW